MNQKALPHVHVTLDAEISLSLEDTSKKDLLPTRLRLTSLSFQGSY